MKKMLLIASLILAAVACRVESAHPWDPNWGGGGETPVDPEKKPEAKPRYVWIDAAANFDDYGNSREKIREDCQKMARTGFTDIIVDVRPTTGDVLF